MVKSQVGSSRKNAASINRVLLRNKEIAQENKAIAFTAPVKPIKINKAATPSPVVKKTFL